MCVIGKATPQDIIRVPRPPYRKKKPNLYTPEDLPDHHADFEFLHANRCGRIIRKHTGPEITENDPVFSSVKYDPSLHQEKLEKELSIGPDTPPEIKQRITALIQKYWCCFDDSNVKVPVRGYQCVIDTGTSPPTVAKNIRYGIHEIPIMQKAIDALLEDGFICLDTHSSWLSRIVLAPKPHQEHVQNIDDFIWRFCISYIALNQITKLVSYYIPRCDDAVEHGFGNATVFFLMDACSGYHQIEMEHHSSLKTAFAGPYGKKYRYKVMPFGLVNGPATYVIMIHDLKDHWDHIARTRFKLDINQSNNTTIIIDDTFGFTQNYDQALAYIESILIVAERYRLSWKLKKCSFFPASVEFVGHDVKSAGNTPAESKDRLLENWPIPTQIRDISSFVGFGNFYARYLPFFDFRVYNLRLLIKDNDFNSSISKEQWSEKVNAEFHDIRDSILSKPLLRRVDRSKRPYLRTDFSSKGMGFVLLQPGDDTASIEAMKREDAGGECQFDIKKSGLRLLPCAFGCRMTRGNEKFYHSYYGEATALKFGISKNQHVLYGRPFTHIGDCIAIKWIMSYDDSNHVIRRIQMELVSWWFTLCHRPNRMMIDADYFSRLGIDLHIDPLLHQYITMAESQYKSNPPASIEETVPDCNLPNYRGKRQDTYLSHIPVLFTKTSESFVPNSHHIASAQAAHQILNHEWILYGFGSGHFLSNIKTNLLPIKVTIAADATIPGRSLLHDYGHIPTILEDTVDLIKHCNHIQRKIEGYYIICPSDMDGRKQSQFLQLQVSLISKLKEQSNLECVVFEMADFSRTNLRKLIKQLQNQQFMVHQHHMHFPAYNDSIDGSSTFIIAINKNYHPDVCIDAIVPPPHVPQSILGHLHTPFNTKEYAIYDKSENHTIYEYHSLVESQVPRLHSKPVAYLHDRRNESTIGRKIYASNHPAPPLEPFNFNPFGQLFGILYEENNETYVRCISLFEYASMFKLDPDLITAISKDVSNIQLLYKACPSKTSFHILDTIIDKLHQSQANNTSFYDSNQPNAAAAATAYSFVAGATTTKLPNRNDWLNAYKQDPECDMICKIIKNPALLTKEHLEKVHYVYRQPLRRGLIIIEDGMLIFNEPIDINMNSIKLRVVPHSLRNLIFVAFHSNPIGGHFGLYHTFHRIRLRYHWPHMYKYVHHMINTCAGCKLAHSKLRKASSIVYNFPIDEPFKVIHADEYSVGSDTSFDGVKTYMNVLCGMTGFAVSEPIMQNNVNAKGFAKAMMKILLNHGICHTIVIDKDSKFLGVFKETTQLLQLRVHVASSSNHDAVLTERYHVYLNKALTIFCQERDSIRTSTEAVLLCQYAWNSAPVIGTDISRSLIVTGREFRFPIDFSSEPFVNLRPSAQSVENYAADQQTILTKAKEIFKVLIEEHRAMHREYINSNRPDPIVYNIGDTVFARRQVQSSRAKGRVGKISVKATGPWRITKRLSGSSYEIQHMRSRKTDKKKAFELSPYPLELLPFAPLSGPDTSFSQIHRPIKKHPYMNIGIDNTNDNRSNALVLFPVQDQYNFPSIFDLNNELVSNYPPDDIAIPNPVLLTDNTNQPTLLQSINNLIQSEDKLYFVIYSLPNSQRREWKLVRVNMEETFRENPIATQDGRFLCEFLICHPEDKAFNAPNQRYWTEYHEKKGKYMINTTYHLVKPTVNQHSFVQQHNLVPFTQWFHLFNESTYLHGPFDFASIDGRKTKDRIDRQHWQILASLTSKYDNEAPSMMLKNYTFSYHVNTALHMEIRDTEVLNRINDYNFHTHFYQL